MKIHVDEGPLSPTMGEKCVAIIQKPYPITLFIHAHEKGKQTIWGKSQILTEEVMLKPELKEKNEVLRLSSWNDSKQDGKTRAPYGKDEQVGTC